MVQGEQCSVHHGAEVERQFHGGGSLEGKFGIVIWLETLGGQLQMSCRAQLVLCSKYTGNLKSLGTQFGDI